MRLRMSPGRPLRLPCTLSARASPALGLAPLIPRIPVGVLATPFHLPAVAAGTPFDSQPCSRPTGLAHGILLRALTVCDQTTDGVSVSQQRTMRPTLWPAG